MQLDIGYIAVKIIRDKIVNGFVDKLHNRDYETMEQDEGLNAKIYCRKQI